MTGGDRLLPAALRGQTSFVLIRLAGLLRQGTAERLALHGLNHHQHAILCALDEFGPAAQKDVATRLGLDSGDLVAFLDGLQRAGYLDRDRDQRDRRRQILTITPAGRQVLSRVEALLDEATRETLDVLAPAERAELHRLATAVLAARAGDSWTPGAAPGDVSPGSAARP